MAFDHAALRALSLAINWDVHGVPASVTRQDEAAIDTRVIWLTFVPDLVPSGFEFQRQDPRLIMGVRRDEVATVPVGTLIEAPPKAGEDAVGWRVDGVDRQEADHTRVIVVRDPDWPREVET